MNFYNLSEEDVAASMAAVAESAPLTDEQIDLLAVTFGMTPSVAEVGPDER